MELSEKELRERAEYRRLVDEEFERKRKTGFKDAAEPLKAFRGSASPSPRPTIAAPGTGRENAGMAERHVWILPGELVVHGWDSAADRRGPAAAWGGRP
jgi:hypothetical protein